jgi:hypothetical protein
MTSRHLNSQIRPAELDKDLRCFFVDHNDPYLKIGPFKYELKHANPEIGLFHDLVTFLRIGVPLVDLLFLSWDRIRWQKEEKKVKTAKQIHTDIQTTDNNLRF